MLVPPDDIIGGHFSIVYIEIVISEKDQIIKLRKQNMINR